MLKNNKKGAVKKRDALSGEITYKFALFDLQ